MYTSLPPPPRHRMHLRDVHGGEEGGEGLIVRIFYNLPNRLDVYVDSALVTATLSPDALSEWDAQTPHGRVVQVEPMKPMLKAPGT